MMIDSALKDTADDNAELINFDKHRKEFEVLTQIRLLQGSAALYRIAPDDDFWLKFCSIPVYSDNERFLSHDLMCSYYSCFCYASATVRCAGRIIFIPAFVCRSLCCFHDVCGVHLWIFTKVLLAVRLWMCMNYIGFWVKRLKLTGLSYAGNLTHFNHLFLLSAVDR